MRKVNFVFVSTIILLLFVNAVLANIYKDVSLKTELFELYAPNKSELKSAKEEIEFAAKNFEKYFGEKPPKIVVYIVNTPQEVPNIDFSQFVSRGLSVLPFVSTSYLKKYDEPNSKKISLGNAKVLSHEAAHKYFITYVNKKMTKKRSAEMNLKYGHPEIADWFDEAIATLSEYKPLKKRRYDFLNENMNEIIPLKEFFSMEHPFFARNKVNLTGKKVLSPEEAKEFLKNNPNITTKKSGVANVRVIKTDKNIPKKEVMFYSQALAFTDFLISQKGDLIIKKITDELMKGTEISKVFKIVDPKYENLETLEKEWKSWVKSKENSK